MALTRLLDIAARVVVDDRLRATAAVALGCYCCSAASCASEAEVRASGVAARLLPCFFCTVESVDTPKPMQRKIALRSLKQKNDRLA